MPDGKGMPAAHERPTASIAVAPGDDLGFDVLAAAACGAHSMEDDSCNESSSQGSELDIIGVEIPDDAMLFSNHEMKVYLENDRDKVAVNTSAFGRTDCLTNAMLKAMSGISLLRRHLPLHMRYDLCKQVRRSAGWG